MPAKGKAAVRRDCGFSFLGWRGDVTAGAVNEIRAVARVRLRLWRRNEIHAGA